MNFNKSSGVYKIFFVQFKVLFLLTCLYFMIFLWVFIYSKDSYLHSVQFPKLSYVGQVRWDDVARNRGICHPPTFAMYVYPLENKHIPQKWHFEDDFPFPQVGYVSPLEGIYIYHSYSTCTLIYQVYTLYFYLTYTWHLPLRPIQWNWSLPTKMKAKAEVATNTCESCFKDLSPPPPVFHASFTWYLGGF